MPHYRYDLTINRFYRYFCITNNYYKHYDTIALGFVFPIVPYNICSYIRKYEFIDEASIYKKILSDFTYEIIFHL